jgi:hypothetical protein
MRCDVLCFAKIPAITSRNERLNVFGLWLRLVDGGTIPERAEITNQKILNLS